MSIFDEQEHLQRLLDAAEGPARRLADHRDVIDRAAEVSRAHTPAGHLRPELDHVKFVERLDERFAAKSEQLRVAFQFGALARATLPTVPDIAQAPALHVNAVLPDPLRLAGIAEQMARRLASFPIGPSASPSWDARLETQMAAVTIPWVSTSMPELSFEGFAIVSRLGRAVRAPSPFDERVRERVDEDLGDVVDVDD